MNGEKAPCDDDLLHLVSLWFRIILKAVCLLYKDPYFTLSVGDCP